MSALTDAVRHALSGRDMAEVTADVKQLLCDELARVDPTAEIHRTEYFNHSYVPDVVVGWPGQEPREVFLRFISSPEQLLTDSEHIGTTGPVIFDLSAAAQLDRPEEVVAATDDAAVQASERFPKLLVTDTEATEHIRPDTTENLIERLVVSHVLMGGRGRLSEAVAQATVHVSRAGYAAAIAAEPDAVRAAVEVARQVLEPGVERRVERSLQLLWWVGGGAPDEFPISVLDDMELNAEDTRDFLRMVFTDQQDIDDETFWSRLADRLSFDTLVEVGNIEQSTNLNRLMLQLAGRLQLSHVALDTRDRPLPPHDELAWGIDDYFLQLRGPDWLCRFTPHGNRFSQRRGEGRSVPLADADTRSDGYLVEEAEIDEATRQVVLTRKAVDPTGQRGTSLQALASGFADDAAVRTITVLIGESYLTVDFDRMMVGARPDATVRRMAAVSTRLLAAVDEDAQQELSAFLGS